MHWLTSRSILAGSQQASKEVRTRGTRADKKVLASIDANGVEMINVHRLAGVHASRTKYTIILAFVWPEPAGKHRCKRDDADVLTNHWAGQLAHEFPCKPQPCEGHREKSLRSANVQPGWQGRPGKHWNWQVVSNRNTSSPVPSCRQDAIVVKA